MKILIIEDDSSMLTVLKHFLEPVASNITVARGMEEALKAVSDADELHLITVDLGLPDSDIQSTVGKIKEIRKKHPESLIVVVTGNDIPGLEEDVMSQGADGFVLKQNETFTPKGFLQVIAAIVAKFVAAPNHYNRSLDFLEKVSGRIAQLNLSETSR